jgi:hypothetical protein
MTQQSLNAANADLAIPTLGLIRAAMRDDPAPQRPA